MVFDKIDHFFDYQNTLILLFLHIARFLLFLGSCVNLLYISYYMRNFLWPYPSPLYFELCMLFLGNLFSNALFSICQCLPNVYLWVSMFCRVPNHHIQILTQHLTSKKFYGNSNSTHVKINVLFSPNLNHQSSCSNKQQKYHPSLLSISHLPHKIKYQVHWE